MSYDYVNRIYKVNAKAGERVKVAGRLGTIVRHRGSTAHVHVRFDGSRCIVPCHPTWEIEYLGAVKA